ncbi:MAG: hypothetical protein ACRYG8_39450 [Janthinobacterium lividum]
MQLNIISFSEDRSSVTIVGKSAGDGSVSIRVTSPRGIGSVFKHAITKDRF